MSSSQYFKIRNSCTIGEMLKWIAFKIPLTDILKLLYIFKFFLLFDQISVISKSNFAFYCVKNHCKAHKAGQGAEVQQDFYDPALTILPKRKAWEQLECRFWQVVPFLFASSFVFCLHWAMEQLERDFCLHLVPGTAPEGKQLWQGVVHLMERGWVSQLQSNALSCWAWPNFVRKCWKSEGSQDLNSTPLFCISNWLV